MKNVFEEGKTDAGIAVLLVMKLCKVAYSMVTDYQLSSSIFLTLWVFVREVPSGIFKTYYNQRLM